MPNNNASSKLVPKAQDIKSMIASVENYGNLKGDWAQLTGVVLKDLQRRGQFKDISLAEVKSDPKLYEKVTNAYLKRIEDFGIPDDPVVKTIWWRAPALYKKYNGDVDMIEDKNLKNVMQNRIKNLAQALPGNAYTDSLDYEGGGEGGNVNG